MAYSKYNENHVFLVTYTHTHVWVTFFLENTTRFRGSTIFYFQYPMLFIY